MPSSVLETGQEIANAPHIWYTSVTRPGCFLRLEGSARCSGSAYLAQLTPDGRVFVHAKDMPLSGRQLKLSIYGAILEELGVDLAVLPDPAAAQAAMSKGRPAFRDPGGPWRHGGGWCWRRVEGSVATQGAP